MNDLVKHISTSALDALPLTTVTKTWLERHMRSARFRTGKRRLERSNANAWSIRQRRNAHARWSAGYWQRTWVDRPIDRLHAKILRTFGAEIERRGGEVEIHDKQRSSELNLVDRAVNDPARLVLLGVDGWRYYSARFGSRFVSIRYLCGYDDNGPFAVRVPGTRDTIKDALDWLEPRAVKTARLDGRRVLRQGDVYAVEMRSVDDAEGNATVLPDTHRWDETTRTLHHEPTDGRAHAPLHVPFSTMFVQQHAYEIGRSGRKGGAD